MLYQCLSNHFKCDCPQYNDNTYLLGCKNDSHNKQNYHQQRGGHQNNPWHYQRNLTGHIACMTFVTSSTAFMATKYCKNFERKYNNDNVCIVDSHTSDHMSSDKSVL